MVNVWSMNVNGIVEVLATVSVVTYVMWISTAYLVMQSYVFDDVNNPWRPTDVIAK